MATKFGSARKGANLQNLEREKTQCVEEMYNTLNFKMQVFSKIFF